MPLGREASGSGAQPRGPRGFLHPEDASKQIRPGAWLRPRETQNAHNAYYVKYWISDAGSRSLILQTNPHLVFFKPTPPATSTPATEATDYPNQGLWWQAAPVPVRHTDLTERIQCCAKTETPPWRVNVMT